MLEKIKTFRQRSHPPYLIPVLLVLLALILEIFVFNYRFWQSRNYEPLEISPLTADEAVLQLDEGEYYFSDNESGLYFSGFDVHINNIYVDVENVTEYSTDTEDIDARKRAEYLETTAERVNIQMLVTDASNYYGIELPARAIVSSLERTKYIHLHLAGNSTYIRMAFPDSEGDTVKVSRVILNAKVPFFFSLWRFLFVSGLFLLLYGLRPHSKVYDIRLNLKERRQKLALAAVLLLQISFSMGMTSVNTILKDLTYENSVNALLNYQMRYVRLCNSLLAGRLDVDVRSDEEMEALAEVDNPYDTGLLKSVDVTWNDYAYYNGHYYVYFGIVPCLIFNIPYKLLTGNDLTMYPCVMILMPLFILSAFALIYALFKRYLLDQNRSVPFATYVLLALLFVNGSAIGLQYGSPDAYFLPIFTALFFVTLGLTLWISSVRQENGVRTISGGRLFFGSLCMALTGGCRPQFLIAMFLALPLFWDTVFRDRLLFAIRDKQALKHTLLFVMPIIAVACGLCWYNYARFGNIFDFGANYNQTNNDMTTRGFEPYRAAQGIFYYLLQMPDLKESFPYLTETTQVSVYTGTSIMLDSIGGVLWLQPAVLTLPLMKTVREECRTHKLLVLLWMLIAFGILVPCVDSMMAGIVDRYCLDFYWMWGLASVLVLALADRRYAGSAHEAGLRRLVLGLTIVTVFISVLMAMTHNACYDTINVLNPPFYYGLQSLFEFWY